MDTGSLNKLTSTEVSVQLFMAQPVQNSDDKLDMLRFRIHLNIWIHECGAIIGVMIPINLYGKLGRYIEPQVMPNEQKDQLIQFIRFQSEKLIFSH